MKLQSHASTAKPLFSIITPTRARPELLKCTIESVLQQDYTNYELVVSNNGADEATHTIACKYLTLPHHKYIEQTNLLDMPTHWAKLTPHASGEYILFLTDRSILKKGALQELENTIVQHTKKPKIVSWPWDLYYDDLQLLRPHLTTATGHSILQTELTLAKIAKGTDHFPYFLPRGLNSAVQTSFVRQLETQHQTAFKKITPDFTFAFLCLLNTDTHTYLSKSLFVSHGLFASNGAKGIQGSHSTYLNTLNLDKPYKHTPCDVHLDSNSIHEDFLSMVTLCNRPDLIASWNISRYYIDCLAEVDQKYQSHILPLSDVRRLEIQVRESLTVQEQKVQREVARARTTKPLTKRIMREINRSIPKNILAIGKKTILTKRLGCIHYGTAMEAAGLRSPEQ